jgi:hypothetical protein
MPLVLLWMACFDVALMAFWWCSDGTPDGALMMFLLAPHGAHGAPPDDAVMVLLMAYRMPDGAGVLWMGALIVPDGCGWRRQAPHGAPSLDAPTSLLLHPASTGSNAPLLISVPTLQAPKPQINRHNTPCSFASSGSRLS